jgi:glycosyltransferase involved in cell wall biosynthesis
VSLPLAFHRLVDRLPWRVASRIRARFPAPMGFSFLLNDDPPVVLIPEDFYDDAGATWTPFFQAVRDTKVDFVCLVRWGLEGAADYRQRLPRVLREHAMRYPRHRFVYLANNAAQQRVFDQCGARAVFVNQNALADERPFAVLDGVVKRHDAIYNAVMAPFKRHELAADVSRLALITYFTGSSDGYFESIRALLANAAWLNFGDGAPEKSAYRMIPQQALARHLNEARVGLCLSADEGSMFASVEYLLCGLPIVTTESIGGRDVLFDPDYVATVDANAHAVAEGVRRMLNCPVPASEIRARTLRRMSEHRERLLDLLAELVSASGKHFDRDAARKRIFPNPLYKLRPLHEIAGLIRSRPRASP